MSTATTSTVYQLEHNNTWFENLAVRSNGDILATRLDAPEVWLIEPATGKGRALVTIPGVLGTIGITETALDIFVFGAGNLSISPLDVVPGSLKLFSLDLSRKDPKVELITSMPDAVLINGITPWSTTEVLVADTILGAIYKVNTVTGAYETSLSGPDFAGANGVSVQDGYLYYTSSSNQTLSRVLVNSDLIPGPMKVIYSGASVDDFVLAPDGTAYVATLGHNQVIKSQVQQGMVPGPTDGDTWVLPSRQQRLHAQQPAHAFKHLISDEDPRRGWVLAPASSKQMADEEWPEMWTRMEKSPRALRRKKHWKH
ncbi:hypothetical protein K4K58_003463 [Colletotrichum sp. SAR11_239]|nr:hypothetical protein K4K58_003463 [Colletotrichum sp. SAR11_239]